MEQTVNVFQDGLLLDTHPMVQGNKTLSDALNATFITLSGNEVVLLNDMGNRKIPTGDGEYVTLPKGYEPVGMKEYGGVIYIASYNPITDKSLLGSFPSPERAASPNDKNSDISIIDILNSFANEGRTSRLDVLNTLNLHNGDKYVVYNANIYQNTNDTNFSVFGKVFLDGFDTNSYPGYEFTFPAPAYTINSPLYKFSLGVMSDEFVDITEKTTDYIIKRNPNFPGESDNLTSHQKWAASTYLEKFSGKLALKTELIVPEVKVDVIPEKIIIPETNIETIVIYLTLPTEDNVSYWDGNGNSTVHILSTELTEPPIYSYQLDLDWSNWNGNPQWADAKHTIIYFQKKILESDTFSNFKVVIFPQFHIPTFTPDGNQIHVNSIEQISLKSSEFNINASKIGSGDIEIVKWKWYYNKDSNILSLNYLLQTYPLSNIEEGSERIEIVIKDKYGVPKETINIDSNLNLEYYKQLLGFDSREVYRVQIIYYYTLNGELSETTSTPQNRWFLTTALLNGYYYNSSIKDFGDTNNVTIQNALTLKLEAKLEPTSTGVTVLTPPHFTTDRETIKHDYEDETSEYYLEGKVTNYISFQFYDPDNPNNAVKLKLKNEELYPEDLIIFISLPTLYYTSISKVLIPELSYYKTDNSLKIPTEVIRYTNLDNSGDFGLWYLRIEVDLIYRTYISSSLRQVTIDKVYTRFWDFLKSLKDNINLPALGFGNEDPLISLVLGEIYYGLLINDSNFLLKSDASNHFNGETSPYTNSTYHVNLLGHLQELQSHLSSRSSYIEEGIVKGAFRNILDNKLMPNTDNNNDDLYIPFYWIKFHNEWALLDVGEQVPNPLNTTVEDMKNFYEGYLISGREDTNLLYYSFTNKTSQGLVYFKSDTELYTSNSDILIMIVGNVKIPNVLCTIDSNYYNDIFINPYSNPATEVFEVFYLNKLTFPKTFKDMILNYKAIKYIPAALEIGENNYYYVDRDGKLIDPNCVYTYNIRNNQISKKSYKENNETIDTTERMKYFDNIHYIPSNNKFLLQSYENDKCFSTRKIGIESELLYITLNLNGIPCI